MFKKTMSLLMVLMAAGLFTAPTISDVQVDPHGFLWDGNGGDVHFMASGIEGVKAYYLATRDQDLQSGPEKSLPSRDMLIPPSACTWLYGMPRRTSLCVRETDGYRAED